MNFWNDSSLQHLLEQLTKELNSDSKSSFSKFKKLDFVIKTGHFIHQIGPWGISWPIWPTAGSASVALVIMIRHQWLYQSVDVSHLASISTNKWYNYTVSVFGHMSSSLLPLMLFQVLLCPRLYNMVSFSVHLSGVVLIRLGFPFFRIFHVGVVHTAQCRIRSTGNRLHVHRSLR